MAETTEIFMQVPEVRKMVSTFSTMADVLKGIKLALQALAAVLHASALWSFGATEAEAWYIDQIVPNFDTAIDKMQELSSDINAAANAYELGDYSGSTKFTGS